MLIALMVVNAVVYLIFVAFAVLLNKVKGKEVVGKRTAGNVGVTLLFLILFVIAYVHMVPSLSLGDASPQAAFKQGEQVGHIAGTLSIPALFVAILLGLVTKKSGSK
jgi:hypothetical protein